MQLGKKIKDNVLIVIACPTASGKTDLAIFLAKEFNAEIISADSRQVYKEMNIGTAKPDEALMKATSHHFIGNITIKENYNVGIYENDVISFLDTYFLKNNIAILCGGTGLYIDAVLNGLDNFPDVHRDIIIQLESDLAENGLASASK